MEHLLRARFLELANDDYSKPVSSSNVNSSNAKNADKKKKEEEETDAQKVSAALELLLQERSRERTLNGGTINVLGCGAPELLVLAAEAALHCNNPHVATQATDEFFLQDAPKNQFYCRALFAKAMVECHQLRTDAECYGQELISRVVAAAKLVMEGISVICTTSDSTPVAGKGKQTGSTPPIPSKYAFLVYNGSVHLWSILRPLQRRGTKEHTIESMQFFVAALQEVKDPNIPWLMRLQTNLALAYSEAQDTTNAQRVLKEAMTLYKTNETLCTITPRAGSPKNVENTENVPRAVRIPRKLFKELNHAMVQVACQNPAEAVKLAKQFHQEHGDIDMMIQCIRSGAISAPADIAKTIADLAAEIVPTNIVPTNSVSTNISTPSEKSNIAPSSKSNTVERLAQLGRVAMDHGITDIANNCRAAILGFKGAKSPQSLIAQHLFTARSLVDEETCRVQFNKTNGISRGTPGFDKVNTEINEAWLLFQVAQRVESMSVLESAIQTAKRHHDFGTLEEACVMLWNYGLPLLQPHLRKNVLRAFLCAVNALEEVDSNRKMLRAHFHTEVAKCEIEADFVAKATIHVSKALALDYAVPVKSNSTHDDPKMIEKLEQKARSLDSELQPLRRRLELRSKIYMEPDKPEDKAILCIEQAKEAREYYVKHSLLVRAGKWLDMCADANIYSHNVDTELLQTVDKSTELVSEKVGSKFQLERAPGIDISAKDFVELWSTVAKLAWQGKMVNVAQKAAEKVILARSCRDGQSILPASILLDTNNNTKTSAVKLDEQKESNKDEKASESKALDDLVQDWDVEENKSVLILKAEAHFLMAEIMMELLRQAEEEDAPLVGGLSVRALGLVVPQFMIDKVVKWEELNEQYDAVVHAVNDDETDEEEEEEYYFDLDIPTFKEKLLSHLQNAMKIGMLTIENWIIENACCYLWNYHMHVFATRERAMLAMPSLLSTMTRAEEALGGLETRNLALHSRMCFCLAFALNEQGHLEQAAEVARRGSTLGDARHNGQLVGILHRAQRQGGRNEPLPADPLQLVFAVLELVKLDPTLMPQAEKIEFLKKAVQGLTNSLSASQQSPPVDKKSASMREKGDKPKSETSSEERLIDETLLEELWTKLGLELLDVNDPHGAIRCVKQATQLAPPDSATTALLRVPQKRARWYSVAETVYGLGLSQTISSTKQEITLQDKIREDSFLHLCSAAAWGVRAGVPRLIVDAGMHFCNIASPFLVSDITRRALLAPTKKLLSLIQSGATSDGQQPRDQNEIDLHLKLYEILFQCLIDMKCWADGLNAVKAAFRFIPQSSHSQLWKSRVIFSSKLGLDVVTGLNKMSTGQAQIQATLARAAANPKDQLKAYSVVLETCTNLTDRAKYLIEVAEWMHTQHFDAHEVINTLMLAADVLIDIEDPGYEDDEEGDYDLDDGRSVSRSRMTKQTSRSKQSSRSKHSSRSGKSGKSSRGKRSGRSEGSKSRFGGKSKSGRSKATKRTGKSVGSKRTTKTKSGENDEEEEEEDDDLIEFHVGHVLDMIQVFTMLARVSKPRSWGVTDKDAQEMVKSTVKVGAVSRIVVSKNKISSSAKVGDRLTVSVKSPSGGGRLTSPRTKESLDEGMPLGGDFAAVGTDRGHYLALATHYIRKLWELCITSANTALVSAEKQRTSADKQQQGGAGTENAPSGNSNIQPAASAATTKKGNGETKEEIPKQSILFDMPNTLEEWVAFGHEKAIETVKLGETRMEFEMMTLTQKSIGRPGQRIHYLVELIDMLKREGMHDLCVPALTTAHVIGMTGLAQEEQAVTKVVMKVDLALLLEKLGHSNECRSILDLLDLTHISEAHFVAFRDQILQMERLQDRSVQHPYLDLGFLATLFGEVPFTTPEGDTLGAEEQSNDENVSKKPDSRAPALGPLSFNGELHIVHRHRANNTQIRHQWVREANRLAKIGENVAAKFLLREACRHNVALEDLGNHAKALQVLARILVMEGDVESALCAAVTSWRCMRAAGADIFEWKEGAVILTTCLERNERWREAIELLDGLRVSIECIIERRSEAGSFACHSEEYGIIADLLLVSAQVYRNQAIAVAPFEKVDSVGHLEGCIDRSIEACALLSEHGLGWRMTNTALECGTMVLDCFEAGVDSVERLTIVKQWLRLALHVAQAAYASQEHEKSGDTVSQTLAQLQLVLGRCELLAAYSRHTSLETAREERRLAHETGVVGGRSGTDSPTAPVVKLSVVGRWLLETTPVPEPNDEEMQVPLSSRAIALFSGAHFISQHLSLTMRVRSMCLLASALGTALYVGESDVDQICGDVWDEKHVLSVRTACSDRIAKVEFEKIEKAAAAAAAAEREDSPPASTKRAGKAGKGAKTKKGKAGEDTFSTMSDEELKRKQLEAYNADLELGPARKQAAGVLKAALDSARIDCHGRIPPEELALTAQALVQCLGYADPRETLNQLFYMQHIKAMKWMQKVYFEATVGCGEPSSSTMFWENRLELLGNVTDISNTPRGRAINAYMSKINTPLRLLSAGIDPATGYPDLQSSADSLDSVLANQDSDVVVLVLSVSSVRDYVYAGLLGNQTTDKVGLGRAFLGKDGGVRLDSLRNKMAAYSKILARFMVQYGNTRAEAKQSRPSTKDSTMTGTSIRTKTPVKSSKRETKIEVEPKIDIETKESGDGSNEDVTTEPQRILVDCESEETLAQVNEGLLDPEDLLISIATELWELVLAPVLMSSTGLSNALREACERGAKLFYVADSCIARLPINVALVEHGFVFAGVSMDYSVPFAQQRLARVKEMQQQNGGKQEATKYLYVADPRAESEEEEHSMEGNEGSEEASVDLSRATTPASNYSAPNSSRSMGEFMESLSKVVGGNTDRFQGICGKPSAFVGTREWQDSAAKLSKGDKSNGASVSGGGVLIYHGYGTVLNFIRPSDFADIDLSNCQLAVLADRCTNERFHRRFAKSRTTQKRSRAALEEPLESAALMSLMGVQAVVMNQWSATRPANEALMRRVLRLPEPGSGKVSTKNLKNGSEKMLAIDVLKLKESGGRVKSRELRNAILVGHPSIMLP